MSVEAYKAVWTWSQMTGNGKLLMLALAEFADDRGRCWPGIDRLAEMVGVGRRTVVRLLQQAEEAGELAVMRQAGRGNTNDYRILLLEKGDPGGIKGDPAGKKGDPGDTYIAAEKGDPGGIKGDPAGRKGDPGGRKGDPGDTRSVRDPLVDPSGDPSGDRAPTAAEAFPFRPAGESRAPLGAADLRSRVILQVCGLDGSVPAHVAEAENAAAQLAAYSPDYIGRRYGPGGWWYSDDWRGRRGDQPTPRWLVETINKQTVAAAPASSNGHGPAKSRAQEALEISDAERARLRAELGIIAGAGE